MFERYDVLSCVDIRAVALTYPRDDDLDMIERFIARFTDCPWITASENSSTLSNITLTGTEFKPTKKAGFTSTLFLTSKHCSTGRLGKVYGVNESKQLAEFLRKKDLDVFAQGIVHIRFSTPLTIPNSYVLKALFGWRYREGVRSERSSSGRKQVSLFTRKVLYICFCRIPEQKKMTSVNHGLRG